jgi:Endoribonuclease L-PSP
MRINISSGSPFEPEIGFSRAVRTGPFLFVAGTAPVAEGGGVAAPGDVYGQTKRCIEIAANAIAEAGFSLATVVRTPSCWSTFRGGEKLRERTASHFLTSSRHALSLRSKGSSTATGWWKSRSTAWLGRRPSFDCSGVVG